MFTQYYVCYIILCYGRFLNIIYLVHKNFVKWLSQGSFEPLMLTMCMSMILNILSQLDGTPIRLLRKRVNIVTDTLIRNIYSVIIILDVYLRTTSGYTCHPWELQDYSSFTFKNDCWRLRTRKTIESSQIGR